MKNIFESLFSLSHKHPCIAGVLRPTLMGTKNENENSPNSFFSGGTKNMVGVNLLATVLFWHDFDKLV